MFDSEIFCFQSLPKRGVEARSELRDLNPQTQFSLRASHPSLNENIQSKTKPLLEYPAVFQKSQEMKLGVALSNGRDVLLVRTSNIRELLR